MSIKNGYAICFNEWWMDSRIKNELNILLSISSLSAENGFCFASNSYFSELFGIEEESVSRKIKKLEELGYISISYEKRGCEVTRREIRLTKISIHDCQKNQSTIDKKIKDNNTSINNIKKYDKKNNFEDEFSEFWELYPRQRRGSKDKAYSSFCRAIKEKRATAEKILESVKKYANSDEVKRGFAKGCAAWLNDDRFNCDYGDNKSAELFKVEW